MPDPKIIKEQFRSVSSSYRWMHWAMKNGLDGLQRSTLAALVAKTNTSKILDLACGSGALSFVIAEALEKQSRTCEIVGVDFVEELLDIGRHELSGKKTTLVSLTFMNTSGFPLPFPAASFDTVTIAFGLRYLANRADVYAEALRVLRPGGRLFILETSQPSGTRKLCYNLFAPLIPVFARIIGGNASAHQHIAEAVHSFPDLSALAEEISNAGFGTVTFQRLRGGTLAIHQAVK